MVVVAIIGVISAVAIPSMQNYVRKTRRSEAFNVLAGIYKSQKVYHMENDQYGGTFAEIGFDLPGATVIDATTLQTQHYTYTLEAFAIGTTPNANYSAVATGDLDPSDPMLDIIMIEGGMIVSE